MAQPFSLDDLFAVGIGGTDVEVQPGGPALYALRVFGVAAVREDDVD